MRRATSKAVDGPKPLRPRPDLGPGLFECFEPQAGRRFYRRAEDGRLCEVTAEVQAVLRRRLAERRRQERARERRRLAAAAARGPLDHQQAHSPSVPVDLVVARELVLDGRGGVAALRLVRRPGRRRLTDRRLWERLGEGQRRAAERIHIAFAVLTRGVGLRLSAAMRERIDGTPGEPDVHRQLVQDYLRWSRACRREGVDHAVALDVLVEGLSCAACDRARRRRKGHAAAVLAEALSLYCRLKGWPPD